MLKSVLKLAPWILVVGLVIAAFVTTGPLRGVFGIIAILSVVARLMWSPPKVHNDNPRSVLTDYTSLP